MTKTTADLDARALSSSERYYALNAAPFAQAPDAAYFYPSSSHAVALHELITAIRRRAGFIGLVGEAGTGKTLLCQAFRKKLRDEPLAIVSYDPSQPVDALQRRLLMEFGAATADAVQSGPLAAATELELCSELYQFITFRSAPRTPVLVVDHVQEIERIVDIVAAFSDLQGEDRRLQVVVVGRPSLRTQWTEALQQKTGLAAPAWCELKSLTTEEVGAYVRHRLSVAGAASERVQFAADAMACIAEKSLGVPRAVNEICQRALERGALIKVARIDRAVVSDGLAPQLVEPTTPPLPHVTPADILNAAPNAPGWETSTDVSGLEIDFTAADVPAARLVDAEPEPPAAPAPRPAAKPRRPISRGTRRWIVIGGSTLAVGVVAALIVFVWLPGMTPEPAVAPPVRLRPAAAARPSTSTAPTPTQSAQAAAAGSSEPTAGAPETAQRTAASAPPAAAAPGSKAAVVPQATATAPAAPAPKSAATVPAAIVPAATTAAAPKPASAPPAAAIPAPKPAAAAPAPQAATATRPDAGGGYVVDVATFRRPEGAATLISQLRAMGLAAFERQIDLGSRGSMRQVIAGPFNLADAESALTRIREMPDYQDARVRRME